MFSSRLPWPCPSNDLARLIARKRAEGRDILDLTESNPTRVGLRYPADRIAAALAASGAARYDPDPRGLPVARGAVAAYYARRGLQVSGERIRLTSSTSEAYSFLFKMLADPGERILVPAPSYPLFEYLAALESLRADSYPLVYDGRWAIDLRAVERAVEVRRTPVRAIVVVNPNNPTGQALREDERAALERICAPRDIAIISDEVFLDYPFGRAEPEGGAAVAPATDPAGRKGRGGGRIASVLAATREGGRRRPLAFALGGMSKSCGLPQLKLGWLVAAGPGERVREALDRLDLIADTYLSVGTPIQLAAAQLFVIGENVRRQIQRRIVGNRSRLTDSLASGSLCAVLEADGGWYAVLRLPAVVPEEELVLELLAEDDVLVHPGYFFDFPREAYLVLSLLPEPGVFAEGTGRILARVAGRCGSGGAGE
ncbi:MAG: pyridoxal phosphate-dependent aminotransferase [Acidobacteriota bacterium]